MAEFITQIRQTPKLVRLIRRYIAALGQDSQEPARRLGPLQLTRNQHSSNCFKSSPTEQQGCREIVARAALPDFHQAFSCEIRRQGRQVLLSRHRFCPKHPQLPVIMPFKKPSYLLQLPCRRRRSMQDLHGEILFSPSAMASGTKCPKKAGNRGRFGDR